MKDAMLEKLALYGPVEPYREVLGERPVSGIFDEIEVERTSRWLMRRNRTAAQATISAINIKFFTTKQAVHSRDVSGQFVGNAFLADHDRFTTDFPETLTVKSVSVEFPPGCLHDLACDELPQKILKGDTLTLEWNQRQVFTIG